MANITERRKAARILIAEQLGAKARATLNVRLVDLSSTGARIEHTDILRPGASYAFELPPALGSLVLTAKIVHSRVVGTEATPEGERLLLYQSGLTFVGVTVKQQSALATALERLAAGVSRGMATPSCENLPRTPSPGQSHPGPFGLPTSEVSMPQCWKCRRDLGPRFEHQKMVTEKGPICYACFNSLQEASDQAEQERRAANRPPKKTS